MAQKNTQANVINKQAAAFAQKKEVSWGARRTSMERGIVKGVGGRKL